MSLVKSPMSSILTKSKIVLSGITTMITRAPYTNGQYYRVRKIDVTATDGAAVSGQIVKFWDQDLSSTTAGTVGSASSALIIVGGTVATGALSGFSVTTINKPMDACPRIPFYAGITTLAQGGTTINLELEVV
jgi:hypothetical protein